jgi:GntR family transcriptional regulator
MHGPPVIAPRSAGQLDAFSQRVGRRTTSSPHRSTRSERRKFLYLAARVLASVGSPMPPKMVRSTACSGLVLDTTWYGPHTHATLAQPSFLRARSAGEPLYSRFEELVRERIESGEWLPGTAIPSERDLCAEFRLSRATARKALDRLVADGYLERIPRRGTYVSQPKTVFEALTLRGFSAQALESGASPASRLLRFERVLPAPKIAERLEIPSSQLVYLIERLRTVNDVPVALHQSSLPIDLAPSLREADLVTTSLYELLARSGISVGRAQETLESSLATEYESVLLGVPTGAPMLLLNIRLFTSDGRPLELVKVSFRGDRITLRQEI